MYAPIVGELHICSETAANFGDLKPVSSLVSEPSPGDLPEIDSPHRIPKLRGPVFTITANTNYADVDYSITDDSGLFAIASNGGYTDYKGANDEWHLRINTAEIDPRDGTEIYRSKEGVISAKNDLTEIGSYIVTIHARFFHHVNELNTFNRVLTIAIVGSPDDVVVYTHGAERETFEFDIADYFSGAQLVVNNVRGDLRHVPGTGFQLGGSLEMGESAEAELGVNGGNLVEPISFKFIVKNPDFNDKAYLLDELELDCTREGNPSSIASVNSDLKKSVEKGDAVAVCGDLRRGADVDHGHIDATSMLNLAIDMRFENVQRVLIAYGADLDLSDEDIGRPLHAAAKWAEESIGRFLAEHEDVNIDGSRMSDKVKPIHVLGQRPSNRAGAPKAFAGILVDNEVDVNGFDKDRKTYLHYVAEHGDYESMQPILDKRPNPNEHSIEDSELPLTRAVKHEKFEVLKRLLLENGNIGLNVNLRETKSGKAAIHYVRTGEQLDWVMCAGADWNLTVEGTDAGSDGGKTAWEILEEKNVRYFSYWDGMHDASDSAKKRACKWYARDTDIDAQSAFDARTPDATVAQSR